jgi:cation diffusion facilitator family transporter
MAEAKLAPEEREAAIVRTSAVGIGANVVLAAMKAFVGLASNSIAIVMDAVNNLSDALSSIITIVGTKLAHKQPDHEHPLGYGRIEYLSATIISVIVLYAGVTSFVESAKKIVSPEVADYSVLTLVLVAAAVAVKLILGRYVKHQGERTSSDALVASGSHMSRTPSSGTASHVRKA